MSQGSSAAPQVPHLLLSRSSDLSQPAELRSTVSLRTEGERICSPGAAPGSARRPPPALRKSGLMSASALSSWPCGRISLVCGLLLLVSSPLLTANKMSNCTHPLVPEHGGFRCDPSPCRGFPFKTTIHFFCEPGYHISSKSSSSKCRHGKWMPPIPACILSKDMNFDGNPNDSVSSMATTAVGVSIFLLTTTVCMIVKSRLCPCQSQSGRRSSDQLDLMVDGPPVSLPSYEEAVYGSWGQRIPACSAPGPTQLLLAQEAPGCPESSPNSESDGSQCPLLSSQSPDNPPPPYEEVQLPHPRDRMNDGDIRQLRVALSDDKDT